MLERREIMVKLWLKVGFLRNNWISRKMKMRNSVQLIHRKNSEKLSRSKRKLLSLRRKLLREMLLN